MKSKIAVSAALIALLSIPVSRGSGSGRVQPQQTPREIRDIHVADTAGVQAKSGAPAGSRPRDPLRSEFHRPRRSRLERSRKAA